MATRNTMIECSEDMWEPCKEVIRRYYLDDNLKLEGPDGLIEIMARRHKLHANKPQYEKYFRKWNFRKNLPKDVWVDIGRTLKWRQIEGLESEVYISNHLISTTRLKKEMSRYKAEIESTDPHERLRCLPVNVHIKSPTKRSPTSLAYRPMGLNSTSEIMGITASPISLEGLSFFEFDKLIGDHGHSSTSQSVGLYDSCASSSLRLLHDTAAFSETLSTNGISQGTGSFSFPSNRRFPDLSIETQFLNPQMALNNNRLSMNIASLKLLVFLITNNLATPGSVVNILRQITVMTDLRALRSFLTRPGYVAAAFAEKLFPHAIKAQNVTVVKYLLERGLNPDDCSIYGDYTSTKLYGGLLNLGEMTPLTFACQVGNIQLLLTLLAAGADVNKSVICRSPINHGHKIRLTPLSLAIHRVGICDTSNRTDAAREIVLCLLEAGADVNPSLNGQPEVGWVLSLSEASLTGELATLKLLLERGANVCMLDWDGQTALANFFRYSHLLGDEIALNIITVLIDAGADLELPELISGIQKYSDDTYIKTTPINAAAYSGNLKLFDFLLNICPKIDRYSLLCAVTSRKISTVQQLLERVGRVPSPRKYFNGMELSRALKNKDFDIAELLLEFNVIPYDEDTMRDSFRSAIEAGHLRIIERFLSVVFENQDTWHFSQIVSVAPAVLTGQYDLANYLINCGGRVDAEALKFVVSTGNVPFIQRLLEFYEQPFELNLHPLLAAVEYGNPDIVKILLESNLVASFDTPDITMCVDTAVKNKNLDIFHMLLNAGARLNYDGTADFRKYSDSNVYLTPLALAVSRSDHVGMKLLLEAGADPKDSVALYEAVDKGDLHIVRILLQANTNLSKNFGRRSCSIALKYAVDRNSLEMVRLLLSHAEFANCDLNNDALPSAIRMKDEKILREIIRAGINPNGLTHFTQFYLDMERGSLIYGRFRSHNSQICGTALMCTVKERNLNAVKLIIESGADVNLPATRQTRRTPLQAACEVGFLEAVMLLIDNYEADINAPPSDVGGATALQLAAIGGHVGIAYALLSKGADINAPAAKVYGRTALEGAAENGRYDMVKLLLNSGVCITGPGERQYLRAQKFAAKRKHKTVRKLLESASRTVHITSSGHD